MGNKDILISHFSFLIIRRFPQVAAHVHVAVGAELYTLLF